MEAEGLLFNTRDKSADIHSAGAKVETRDKSTDMQSVGHLAKMETDSLQAERTNKNTENVETELMCEEKHELTEGDFGPGQASAETDRRRQEAPSSGLGPSLLSSSRAHPRSVRALRTWHRISTR